MITSLLRENDVAVSFWRNNDVIFASLVRWLYSAIMVLTIQSAATVSTRSNLSVPLTKKNVTKRLHNRSISQIPQWIRQISHNAPFYKRNMHTCDHFCYKMVYCGIWDLYVVGFVQQVYAWTYISMFVDMKHNNGWNSRQGQGRLVFCSSWQELFCLNHIYITIYHTNCNTRQTCS